MNVRFLSYGVMAGALIFSCAVPISIAAQTNSTQINRTNRTAADVQIKAAEAKPTPRLRRSPGPSMDLGRTLNLIRAPHQDANGNFYIAVPPANGGATPQRTSLPRHNLSGAQTRTCLPTSPNCSRRSVRWPLTKFTGSGLPLQAAWSAACGSSCADRPNSETHRAFLSDRRRNR